MSAALVREGRGGEHGEECGLGCEGSGRSRL